MPPPYNECVDLGQRLRQHRRASRLRQRDVADRIGVDQATVSKWENGQCPDRDRLPAIAHFLGVGLSEVSNLVVMSAAEHEALGHTTEERIEDRVERLERTVAELGTGVRQLLMQIAELTGRSPDELEALASRSSTSR